MNSRAKLVAIPVSLGGWILVPSEKATIGVRPQHILL